MFSRVRASAAVLLVGVALTACSFSSGGSSSASTASANAGAAQSAMAAAKSAGGNAGEPNATKQAAFMAALKTIAPALLEQPDKMIGAARTECSSISGGASQTSLITSTKQRISTANVQLTTAQAAAVVAAIKRYICS